MFGGRGKKFIDIFKLTVAIDELASNMAASERERYFRKRMTVRPRFGLGRALGDST